MRIGITEAMRLDLSGDAIGPSAYQSDVRVLPLRSEGVVDRQSHAESSLHSNSSTVSLFNTQLLAGRYSCHAL